MNRTLFIAAVLFLSEFATAAEHDVPERQDVGVALLATGELGNSVATDHRVYQLVMGQLQKSFRKADFLLSNAALPKEDQPDYSRGMVAIDEAVKALNNPYIDTLALVDIVIVQESMRSEVGSRVQLTIRFYDVSSKTIYHTLQQDTLVNAGCSQACPIDSFDLPLLQMASSMLQPAIASIRSAYGQIDPDMQVAQR